MAAPGNATISNKDLPDWFENVTLKRAIQLQVGDYKELSNITIEKAFGEDNNFSSLIIRLMVVVELQDDSTKTASFLLKVPHKDDAMASIVERLRLFAKEEVMYHKILPKFEQLYRDVGKDVKFAPKAFTFDRDSGDADYVLLEDLQAKQYRNANRLEGLDMEHMKEVLNKMAEFHAASACYVEHFGMFGEDFTVGVFGEKNKSLLKELNRSDAFLNQLKKWKDCKGYYEKLSDSDDYLIDRLLQDQKVNMRQFNVLNHGDLWTNNIMFQYDAFGKIKSSLLIDFQLSKYGTPANDLYYCILSSARKDIKLAQFEFIIRYYYDSLMENLKLLQYHRPLPKLQGIYEALLRNGLAAYLVVSKVLPVVMTENGAESKKTISSADESKLKLDMYGNQRYYQAMLELLPWLDNRGLLDWK